ncbi:copper chaperone for superoxide dismutase [Bacillus rossius redtenbacheri]|uniref:copper chaperone for superoxide dismutase n=1 Tax=Bacillus rossius redtenbacheri TaxID=93214 RepID=UPI002FDE4670
MSVTKIEFAVQMTCQSCVDKVKDSLSGVKGVESVDVSLANQSVIITTTLPSSAIQAKLESTGRRAVLKGYGDGGGRAAAVAVLGCGEGVQGVVRFVQADADTCVVDGAVDGLRPGPHGLHVHELGDLSQGCDSVGDHFSLLGTSHGGPEDDPNSRHTGDLGNICADETGRATFRLTDRVLKVWDIVGRSLVVTDGPDDLGRGGSPRSSQDGNSGRRLACGIIARSAGVFDNPKQICACDGVSLWDERDRPLTGPGRRISNH